MCMHGDVHVCGECECGDKVEGKDMGEKKRREGKTKENIADIDTTNTNIDITKT